MSNALRALGPAGNAMGGGGGSFLPEDYIAARSEARANIITLTLFAVVLGAVIAAFLATHQRWQSIKRRQIEVNQLYTAETKKIEQLKSLESQRASMLEKAEITASLVERIPRWAMLGEITLRMPERMRLDEFKLKSQRVEVKAPAPNAPPPPAIKSLTKKITGKNDRAAPEPVKVTAPRFEYAVTIGGTAEENNDIADFLSSLKSSPVFERVELGFIRESKEADRTLRKFEITAALRNDADTQDVSISLKELVAAKQRRLAERNEGRAARKPSDRAVPFAGAKEGQ